MVLHEKTLKELRNLINEKTEYRQGKELVSFFNQLGFKDSYGYGTFPSRWKYTDDRLLRINGTPELDKCIKNVFAPINFIGRIADLDGLIADFNKYLSFDGWAIIREGKAITLSKAKEGAFEAEMAQAEIKEDDFLNKEFKEISLETLELAGTITDVLSLRFEEIKKCLSANAPLSVIFLSGSSLEGILLGFASKYPRDFNEARSAPKNIDGSTKIFRDWTLSNFIDTAHELGLLKEDVKKFSHSLRDFRNYIHPFEQLSRNFNPDEHTAKICWHVLKAAIFQLAKNKSLLDGLRVAAG